MGHSPYLLCVRFIACANVKMGTAIVGYGVVVNGRLSFTNDVFLFFDVLM